MSSLFSTGVFSLSDISKRSAIVMLRSCSMDGMENLFFDNSSRWKVFQLVLYKDNKVKLV